MSRSSTFLTLLLMPAALITHAQTMTVNNTVEGVSMRVAEYTVMDASKDNLVRPVLPYAVQIQNNRSKAIVYYVLRYTRKAQDGKVIRNVVRMNHLQGGSLLPGSSEVAFPVPGMEALLREGTPPPEIRSTLYQGQTKLITEFSSSSEISVSLDAVIFSDGEFNGPDQSETFRLLTDTEIGIQDLLSRLERASSSMDDSKALLSQLASEPAPFKNVGENQLPSQAVSEQQFSAGLTRAGLYAQTGLIIRDAQRVLAQDGLQGLRQYIAARKGVKSVTLWRSAQ